MDKIRKYYKRRLDEIVSLLDKPDRKFSAKDFHKVRTEVKKVRAISNVISFCAQKRKKNVPLKAYKKIFNMAGKVRELQLEMSRLKELGLLNSQNGLAQSLKVRLDRAKAAFFSLKFPKIKRKIKKNYKKVALLSASTSGEEVERFLTLKSAEINELLHGENLEENQVHLLRKKMKEFSYVVTVSSSMIKERKKVEDYLELLGIWHDHIVMENDLQKMLDSGTLTAEEKVTVEEIRKKIRNKSNNLFEQVDAGRSKISIDNQVGNKPGRSLG